MKRLRKTNAVPVYVRTITFVYRSCHRYESTRPIGAPLPALRDELKATAAAAEVALDARAEATADAQLADAECDDLIRNVQSEAETADRRDPTLGLEKALFPEGLTALIARTGERQAVEAEKLATRLEANGAKAPELAQKSVPALRAAAASIRTAEQAQAEAYRKVGEAQAAVHLKKAQVREELEAVYGALRTLFKANPKRAERFFPGPAARKSAASSVDDEPQVEPKAA